MDDEARASQSNVLVGIAGIVVGIAGVILANSTKLTLEKAFLGGAYVKDGYRDALLIASVLLVVLSVVDLVVSAFPAADANFKRTLRNVVMILGGATAIAGGLIYVGYRHDEQLQAQRDSTPPAPAASSTPVETQPAAPSVDTNLSDYSSPCALNLYGHDASLQFSGPNAASDCESFAASQAPGNVWQQISSFSSESSMPQVCSLIQGNDRVVVHDDGGQYYGAQACSLFEGEGWAASSVSDTSPGSSASTGGPPVVIIGSWQGRRPTDIAFSGDGGNVVTHILWSSWTSTQAVGAGDSDFQNCVPNCAQGQDTPVRATITLSEPSNGHFTFVAESRGHQHYDARYGTASWPGGAS